MQQFSRQPLQRIEVHTSKPIAYDSPDHLQPWGTARDNSTNPRFNRKLYAIFRDLKRPLRILDLGCSGGGFVRSCLNDGCIAVGLEGSDYSKRNRRAEWIDLADYNLFTADLTEPFEVRAVFEGCDPTPLQFDVITSWDVLEHIDTKNLRGVLGNIKKHLLPSGLCIFSISPNEEVINGVKLHQTVEDKSWWSAFFEKHDLKALPEHDAWFNTQYIRGPKYGAPRSFHLVLSPDVALAPRALDLSLSRRAKLFDWWFGSEPYWFIQKLIEPT